MSKRLIEYDPLTRTSIYSDYNELTDDLTVTTEQDVESILDYNKALQNDDDYTRKGIKNEMWHYAQIPNVILEKWLIEEGFDAFDKNNEKALFRKLNSPEYKYLKVTRKIHL